MLAAAALTTPFTEAQLRSAILSTQRIREESWDASRIPPQPGCERYKKDLMTCAVEACLLHGIPPTVAALIEISLSQWNDIADYAKGEYNRHIIAVLGCQSAKDEGVSLIEGAAPKQKGCPIVRHHSDCDCGGAGGDR